MFLTHLELSGRLLLGPYEVYFAIDFEIDALLTSFNGNPSGKSSPCGARGLRAMAIEHGHGLDNQSLAALPTTLSLDCGPTACKVTDCLSIRHYGRKETSTIRHDQSNVHFFASLSIG